MAKFKSELYRGENITPWATVTAESNTELSIAFGNASRGDAITVYHISRREAERLGDLLNHVAMNYMEYDDDRED